MRTWRRAWRRAWRREYEPTLSASQRMGQLHELKKDEARPVLARMDVSQVGRNLKETKPSIDLRDSSRRAMYRSMASLSPLRRNENAILQRKKRVG